MDFAELVAQAASTCSCLKRIIVCVLLDENRVPICAASNKCSPPEGKCPRLGLYQNKDNYTDHCHSLHAEREALKVWAVEQLVEKRPVRYAIVIGHDFACKPCEEELSRYGVDVEIVPSGFGCGLRSELEEKGVDACGATEYYV